MTAQLANKAATTLNGAITNVATSLVVTSATGFPTSGDFWIAVQDGATDPTNYEILKVTAVSGTTFTATREAEDSARFPKVAHGSGSYVAAVETRAALLALLLERACDGRLTLTTAVPVTTADVTAATTVYFTPFRGNRLALYDGANWVPYTFAEISASLSGLTADTNYDVFAYDNSGTLTLELLAWTNATTRATALALQDGVYCKSGTLTKRYVGMIRTTVTTGQCEDSLLRRYVWNAYNRLPRVMRAIDATDNWTYATSAWRQANGATANKVEYVQGLSEEPLWAVAVAQLAATTAAGSMGVGVDSTSADSAQLNTEGGNHAGSLTVYARYDGWPGIGYHYLAWLEYRRTGTVTIQGDGGEANGNTQSGLSAGVTA